MVVWLWLNTFLWHKVTVPNYSILERHLFPLINEDLYRNWFWFWVAHISETQTVADDVEFIYYMIYLSLQLLSMLGSDGAQAAQTQSQGTELCAFCWPMRWVSLTSKVTGGLQGLQAITWSGLWVLTHIPKAELVLPLPVGNGNSPVGRANLLSSTLSPQLSKGMEMEDAANLPQVIWNV